MSVEELSILVTCPEHGDQSLTVDAVRAYITDTDRCWYEFICTAGGSSAVRSSLASQSSHYEMKPAKGRVASLLVASGVQLVIVEEQLMLNAMHEDINKLPRLNRTESIDYMLDHLKEAKNDPDYLYRSITE